MLIAVGAHEGMKLPIPGADLPEVLVNTRFLRDVRLAELGGGHDAVAIRERIEGQRVLVLGGGNVAIDCGPHGRAAGGGRWPWPAWRRARRCRPMPGRSRRPRRRACDSTRRARSSASATTAGHVAGVECVDVSLHGVRCRGRAPARDRSRARSTSSTATPSSSPSASEPAWPSSPTTPGWASRGSGPSPSTPTPSRHPPGRVRRRRRGHRHGLRDRGRRGRPQGRRAPSTATCAGEPLEPQLAPDLPVVKLSPERGRRRGSRRGEIRAHAPGADADCPGR